MTGADLAAAADHFVGTPFRLHGRDSVTGLDCVGLVAAALERCGRVPVAPSAYRLRGLSVAPLLGFAARNGFAPLADDDPTEPGDLLLVRPSPLQAHVLIAATSGEFIHAHAGLGKVVRQRGAGDGTVVARWRFQEG